MENEIFQKQIDYTDSRFNMNYDENRDLNGEIMTKTKLININNNAAKNKDFYINITLQSLYLFFIIIFLLFLNNFRLINNTSFFIILFLASIWFLYNAFQNIWVKFYKFISTLTVKKVQNGIAISFDKYILGHHYNSRICPSVCGKNNGNKTFSEPNIHEVKNDQSLNDWKNGDQPEATWNMRTTEEEKKYNSPQPWYSSISKPTQYRCVWAGSEDGLLPNQPKNMETTIPCKYYPGYREDGRY